MIKKSILLGLLTISTASFANGITIKSDANLDANKSPVVFEINNQTGINFKTVAKDLEQTGQIETYFGSCDDVKNKIHRQVACITTTGFSVNIAIPNATGLKKIESNIDSDSPLPVADAIYKAALNTEKSPFLTKIAYVSKSKRTGVYKLAVANYNGSNARVLLTSPEPILSPSWSNDGDYITYTSYETVRGSIFIHDVRSNRRAKVFEKRGLNAYSTFGSNNHTLLLSASGESKNSHIYRLNILNKQLAKTKNTNVNINAIYPRELPNGNFIFVTLGKNDVPYLMERNKDGSSRYIKHYPLNAPSTDRNGDIVAINGSKLVKMNFKNGEWGQKNVIAIDNSIESPAISNNGLSVFYIFEKNGRNLIANSLISGRKIITISSSTENIIQVSAF
ncbi:hypothetical protein [Photobacterium damselae]|uniref:hypothetical protein n=1 Tax=Photobacterium damselae TaxID=38293 RepID=UPI001F37F3AC|nr:hypothetical protein [Photobacterium damselae]UKA04567.1 hypothetical protein IHC89_23400 [Photobacterium damselae subsp. damselae]